MSFRDVIETAQAVALADTLNPTELAIWERYCREFSNKFHTPLMEVYRLDPFFVINQVNADNLSELNIEEKLTDIFDLIGSLSDREYDIKKERALREEMRLLQEQEAERLKNNEPIHPSLVKENLVFNKNDKKSKELPKTGGINMDLINKNLINRLNNSDNER